MPDARNRFECRKKILVPGYMFRFKRAVGIVINDLYMRSESDDLLPDFILETGYLTAIITARLNAIPITDILIMGPEKTTASLLKVSLVAMNSPVLKDDLAGDLKDIK
jgi:hypothetical protein